MKYTIITTYLLRKIITALNDIDEPIHLKRIGGLIHGYNKLQTKKAVIFLVWLGVVEKFKKQSHVDKYILSEKYCPKKIRIKKKHNLLLIPINKRTDEEHRHIINLKYNGSVREYLLSMGVFKKDD